MYLFFPTIPSPWLGLPVHGVAVARFLRPHPLKASAIFVHNGVI